MKGLGIPKEDTMFLRAPGTIYTCLLPTAFATHAFSLPAGDVFVVAMDTGANAFLFPPSFVIPGTQRPTRKTLVSAAGQSANSTLDVALVCFGPRIRNTSLVVLQQIKARP